MPHVLTHQENITLHRRIFGASQPDAEQALYWLNTPPVRFTLPKTVITSKPMKVVNPELKIGDLETIEKKAGTFYLVTCRSCFKKRPLTKNAAYSALRTGRYCSGCSKGRGRRNPRIKV